MAVALALQGRVDGQVLLAFQHPLVRAQRGQPSLQRRRALSWSQELRELRELRRLRVRQVGGWARLQDTSQVKYQNGDDNNMLQLKHVRNGLINQFSYVINGSLNSFFQYILTFNNGF